MKESIISNVRNSLKNHPTKDEAYKYYKYMLEYNPESEVYPQELRALHQGVLIGIEFCIHKEKTLDHQDELRSITCKSWRHGDRAITRYYMEGEEIHELIQHKNKCGTSWFLGLPEDETQAEIEDITGNTPHWLDKIIEDW